HQRFGFVDYDVAATPQPNLAMKRVVDLFLDSEGFENWRGAVVKFQTIPRPPRYFFHQLIHPFQCLAIVAKDFVNFLGQKITHRSLDQVRLFKNATGRGLVPNQPLNFGPLIEKKPQIPHEVACPLALAYCANNDAEPLRNIELAQNFPETAALFRIFDLARDSAVERGRKRVPKMEKRVFVEADVDEHRLQTHLNVFDAAFVNAADYLARAATLDAVFFETAILEQRHAALEFLHTDY